MFLRREFLSVVGYVVYSIVMKKHWNPGWRAFYRRMLFALIAAVLGLAPMLGISAQGTDRDWESAAGGMQSFDVASVREDKSDGRPYSNFALDSGNAYLTIDPNDVLAPTGSLLSAGNQTLMRYIVFAYKLSGTQELALRFDYYSGLKLHVPEWVRGTRYDIGARASRPATKDQMRLMMQSLLADRFKLAAHWETREAPVFALVPQKREMLGRQLAAHPAGDDCAVTAFPKGAANETAVQRTVSLAALPIPCGMIAHLPAGAGNNRIGSRNVTLAMLASSLPAQTGLVTLPRPVIDRTGLEGGYDFWLEWTPEDTSEVDNHETGGAFREALKNQLGLKLEPAKGAVQVLVIDHVEQPSPN
jgi:uncharacterized protein (TIGR03435 family)